MRDSVILAEAYRNENGKESHAEFLSIRKAKAASLDLTGSTIFTTLEPCTQRNHEGKKPCAQHIIDAKICHVVIGMVDNNPKINGLGIRLLQEAGLVVSVLPDFLAQIAELNYAFLQ